MKRGYSSGATLIELLLVIALFAIIAAAASPFLSKFLLQTNMESTQDKLLSAIHKAQEYSMNNKNNASWGVCVTGNVIRVFTGTCGTPTFSEDTSFSSTVSVSGLSGVTFSRHRGEPSSTLSISITTQIDSRSLSMNTAGGLTID